MSRNKNLVNFQNNLTRPSYNAAANRVISNANRSISNLRDQITASLSTNKDFLCIYGWPQSVSANQFWELSKRNAIANFITDAMAHDCWANLFTVKDNDNETMQEEVGILKQNGVFKGLERADKMNRRNRYSIALVQLDDGGQLHEPLGKASNIESVRIMPYRESGVEITQRDRDPASPRYGMPVMYQAQIIADGEGSEDTDLSAVRIHYTRVVLMNEGQTDSQIMGEPACEPVINDLINLNKTVGGSAEAYFRNASPKLSFTTKSDEFNSAYIDSPEAQKTFDQNANDFANEMKPFMFAGGFDVNAIQTPHASPLDTVKVSLWNISAGTGGVPVRIFATEGSGQLAGAEDKLKYSAIINDRQNNECEGYVNQLFTILNNAGILDALPKTYDLEWIKEEPATEMQQAEIANKQADTAAKISTAFSPMSGLANEYDAGDFVEQLLGFKPARRKKDDIGEINANVHDDSTD